MSDRPPDPGIKKAPATCDDGSRKGWHLGDNIVDLRQFVKQSILAALAGKVVTGSDFEARCIRCRDAARRKGVSTLVDKTPTMVGAEAAARVASNLSPIGDNPSPSTERQARPLTSGLSKNPSHPWAAGQLVSRFHPGEALTSKLSGDMV